MATARPIDSSAHGRRNGQELEELTPAQLEVARQQKHELEKLWLAMQNERHREPPARWWRHIDWHDLALRELIAAVVTGLILSATFYGVESRREQRMLETSERLEDQRQERAQELEDQREERAQELEDQRQEKAERLENVRFVRQLSIDLPDGIKPLVGIDLREAQLSGLNLSKADLTNADLTGADLTGANLHTADLTGANLNHATLISTNLHAADLAGADLTGADLAGANLTGAKNLPNLAGANLSGAFLTGAYFPYTNLSRADLSYADLTGANLAGANLTGANLNGANLNGNPPVGADLTDPIGANLAGADFTGADLFLANLSGADLSAVAGLGDAYLDSTWWCPDSPPTWPQGFDPPTSGPVPEWFTCGSSAGLSWQPVVGVR